MSKFLIAAASVALLLPLDVFAENVNLSLAFGGVDRGCVLHVPAHDDRAGTYPLMIVFHGAEGKASSIEHKTGFDAVADENSFFVAYPESAGGRWQLKGEQNDIDFSDYLIKEIMARYPIDPGRVYISGFSQGGGIVQALVCLRADKIAGAGVVAHNLNRRIKDACRPVRPVSFILFHGTEDPISPYRGGANGRLGAGTLSAQDTAQFWAGANGCQGEPVVRTLPDTLSNGSRTNATEQSWLHCPQDTTVVFYTIEGGGHTWPGAAARKQKMGAASQKINASRIIWDLLSRHRIP